MPVVSLKELKTLLSRGKRLMGLDHSKNSLGLALASPDLALVTPLKTLVRGKFSADVVKLAALCREYDVGGFVIGLPLNMDGSAGPRVDSVRHFAMNLIAAREALGFDPLIAFQDERLSTFAAEDALGPLRGERRRGARDAQAAAQILEDALKTLQ